MPPRLLPRLLSGAVYFSSRSTAIFRLPLIQYSANGRFLSTHVVNNVRQFRIAIIGSGPAGFYAAYKIFGKIDGAKVDMFERLPVPFGLVRFGVAPDHPEVKNCQDKFTEVASSPNFRFIGNVNVGTEISLRRMAESYDAILFAYGAARDRKLGIPGEDLKQVYSAREFVGWYNGLPECRDMVPDLTQGETAVIIGQGNVALDVGRILLSDVDALKNTDIAEHALATLAKSRIRNVRIVGRRGPMQAAFTIKEARELMNLFGTGFTLPDPSLLPVEGKLPRTQKRMVALLRQGSIESPDRTRKNWTLDSLLSPQRFDGNINLESAKFAVNEYADFNQRFESNARVVSTDKTTTIPCSAAFRSIGYKSVEIEGMTDLGISFDPKGIIPNEDGRVVNGRTLPGLYCAGWVKRGPAGVIANTMEDSFATAEAIAQDWHEKRPFLGGEGDVTQGLRSTSWEDWLRIDAAERARGKRVGKEREKFTSVQEMLNV